MRYSLVNDYFSSLGKLASLESIGQEGTDEYNGWERRLIEVAKSLTSSERELVSGIIDRFGLDSGHEQGVEETEDESKTSTDGQKDQDIPDPVGSVDRLGESDKPIGFVDDSSESANGSEEGDGGERTPSPE